MLASGAHIDAGFFNTHEFMQQTVLPCIAHLTRLLAEPSRNRDQLFSRKCLGRRRIPSIRKLRSQARAWNWRMIRDCIAFDWQFTRTKTRRIPLHKN
jgi:hypothetical protein